jgi:hypothetical protein
MGDEKACDYAVSFPAFPLLSHGIQRQSFWLRGRDKPLEGVCAFRAGMGSNGVRAACYAQAREGKLLSPSCDEQDRPPSGPRSMGVDNGRKPATLFVS